MTGLAAAPTLLLILGSIALAVWRPVGRRTAWAIESTAAGTALLSALALGRSLPVHDVLGWWPFEPSAEANLAFGLNSWTWSLLVCALAFGFTQALTSASDRSPSGPLTRSAALAFLAAIGASVIAASALAVVFSWTLVIAAQAWLMRSRAAEHGDDSRRLVQGMDLASLLFLLAAFGIPASGGGAFAALPAASLLFAAGLRFAGALRSAQRSGGRSAAVVFPVAASTLAALAWGWHSAGAAAMGLELRIAGVVLLLGGWISLVLQDDSDRRAEAWAAGMFGAALLAVAVSPNELEAGVSSAGAVLILAGTIGLALPLGKIGTRTGAAAAALMTAGIPGLIGALLLGVVAPAVGPVALGWITVAGLGLLSSTFVTTAIHPETATSRSTSGVASVAAVLILAVAGILFFSLRGAVPAPAASAAPAALVVAFAAGLLLGRIPSERRSRMARTLRWPAALAPSRWTGVLVDSLESLARGSRQVLEGDASLLWALVVVLVGLLLLQGAG